MSIAKASHRFSEIETKIDLSPMIDCVFILLISFIVTTVFVEETGVPSNKMEITGAPPTPSEVQPLELLINSNGVVHYHHRGIDSDAIQGLPRRFLAENPDIPVLISAEEGVKHQLFAKVYGDLKAAGAMRVSFR